MGNLKFFFHKLFKLLGLYWTRKESRKSWIGFISVILLSVCNVYLSVRFNEWKNAFYTALQNYDAEATIQELILFSELAALYILAAWSIFYIRRVIALHWRKEMSTQFIDYWMRNKRYYYIELIHRQMDNPDQRISEDIDLFIGRTIQFTIGIFNAVLTFVSFVFILWNLSGIIPLTILGFHFDLPGYIVWVAILYAIVGTYITHKSGNKLSVMNYNQQRLEADFRYSMMRMREYATAIAAMDGEAYEKKGLHKKLGLLLGNLMKIIKREGVLTAIQSGYSQMANIVPVVVGVPLYMAKKINLGGLMQSASAFNRVEYALSYFLMLYKDFAEWRSVINRLVDFQNHLEKISHFIENNEERQYTGHGEKKIGCHDVSVMTPEGRLLLENISFEVKPGEKVIIEGSNGSGKTTLIRTVMGLWPHYKGRIEFPSRIEWMYIPQQSYIPYGSLYDIVTYPGEKQYDEEEIKKLLSEFGLSYLIGELHRNDQWDSMLSNGEKQKLGFLRAILKKPQLLVLDEATSNMDPAAEEMAYKEILRWLPDSTVISVAQRESLEAYHEKKMMVKNGQLYVIT